MYLVEDTVEKAIYNISVDRRLSHISRSHSHDTNHPNEPESPDPVESKIEAANSLELRDAPLSKLLTKGPGGGEMVDQADLWNCLFRQKAVGAGMQADMDGDGDAERVVGQFLGAEAADGRREV